MRAGTSAGIVAMVFLVIFLPVLARAQSRPAGADDAMVLPLHSSIPTSVRLPDEIEHARILESGEFLSEIVGREVIVRPHLDTPAGTEAWLDVKTATLRRRFLLRVVARAEDAVQELVISTAEPAASASAARQDAAPEAAPEATPTSPAPPPPASAAPSAPSPAPPSTPVLAEPARAVRAEGEGAAAGDSEGSAGEDTTGTEREGTAAAAVGEGKGGGVADDGRDVANAPRFDLSVHAVVALLGTSAFSVPGYEPTQARQPHHSFGVRVVGKRPGAWWAVEVNVSGEWPAGPTVHTGGNAAQPAVVEVSGPLLRADAGLRARFGAPWSATAYAGIGLQAHHLDIENAMTQRDGPSRDMPFDGALALGMGLGYRTRKVLLGLELHIRQGVPDDYRSVAALLSVGCFLDQEKEP